MAKPSTLPEWATGGDVVEPIAGKKAVGFVDEEHPPAQHLNWLFLLIYQWILWFDDVFGGDRVLVVPAAAFADQGMSASGNAAWTYGPGYVLCIVSGLLMVPIALCEGERIKSVTFAVYGDGVADITTATVYKADTVGGFTSIGAAGAITNPPAVWTDHTIDVTDTTLAAGLSLYFQVDAAPNIQIGALRVTYDRP